MNNTKQHKTWKTEHKKKVIVPEKLASFVQTLKQEGNTIATINGSFDLLHAGHLHILFEAKLTANILIVALNSDRSIQQYKGKTRPIIPLQYRIELLTALSFVDYVTWFDEPDPKAILEIIAPDVHNNGSEYGQECIEAETVRSNGGKIHLIDRIDSLSTTEVIQAIQRNYEKD